MASQHQARVLKMTESTGPAERRKSVRYPMTMEAECRFHLNGGSGQVRIGKVLNLSAEGLMLECQNAPASGIAIEMIIPWPSAAIELRLRGEIVRAQGNTVGVRIDESTFRLD